MASWDDVAAIATALPEVAEEPIHGMRAWKVRKKLFVWERRLRKKEIEQLGEAAPDGEILGVRVPDEEAKLALLASEPEVYFTTPHFDGHLSVLLLLGRIPRVDLEEAIVEAWLCRAPKRLADAYLAEYRSRR
ncbi:MAG TPA: MmcQ/YjbR family DNA-binding protein [Solirubrobacterales bacterium]|nr:MmcQ/YjbR family DNA-binding protein [Solirubrobacterales bacterium]